MSDTIYDIQQVPELQLTKPLFSITTLKNNLYQTISNIEPKFILFYIIIICIIITIFGEFNLNLGHVIGIFISIFVIIYYNDYNTINYENEIQDIDSKLNSINPTPKYFYIDATIIDLVYNLLEFQKFNPNDFENMIYNLDNLFKLELDIEKGVNNSDFIFDNVVQLKKNVLNNMGNIMNSIPAIDPLRKKIIDGIKTMQIYLQDHIDKIRNDALKLRNISGGLSSESHLMNEELDNVIEKYNLF